MIETVKVCFPNSRNTQLIINTGVLLIKVVGDSLNFKSRRDLDGLVPVINKPTRVTKNIATAVDDITANSPLHRTINKGIIKLNISDHFPIFLRAETERRMTPEGKKQITKHLANNKTKETLKNDLKEMSW